jgi:hypothetical protein
MFKLFRNFRNSTVSVTIDEVLCNCKLSASLLLSDERRNLVVSAEFTVGTESHYIGMFDKVVFESKSGLGSAQMLEIHQDLDRASTELCWILDKARDLTLDGCNKEYIQEFMRTLFCSSKIDVK